MFRCRWLFAACICFSLVVGSSGQAASAVAGAAGDGGSPVVAFILGALRALRTFFKALKKLYETVSPELHVARCLRKAAFQPVPPSYFMPPWPANGWSALPRRKRSFGGTPPPPQRPVLVINGPLAPETPPGFDHYVEEFLFGLGGDPWLVEAWRDLRTSWFGVVSVRTTKCANQYFRSRFWRWVDSGD